MLGSNISMATKAYEFIKEEPPVLVDWMPCLMLQEEIKLLIWHYIMEEPLY